MTNDFFLCIIKKENEGFALHFDSLKHLHRHSDALIATIAEHYETGKINNPKENHMLMSMLALLCEGKLVGYVTEADPLAAQWKLIDDDDELFDI